MKKLMLAAAGLAAGTAALPAAAQPGSTYRAVGTEPFWSVTIDRRQLTYEAPEGRFTVRAPQPQAMPQGRYYRTNRIAVRVFVGRECSDGMSDRRYADTVEVLVDGRRLRGCGGGVRAAATLSGTSWAIVGINGQRVGGERYNLQFTADRISGAAGCNRFNGTYRVGRDGMQAGPLAMTRMACSGPAMAHERAVADLLRGPVRLSYPDGQTLLIRGDAGEIRLRRQRP